MKRLFIAFLAITLAFSTFGAMTLNSPDTAQAQDAPSGTFFGTWPYVLPPEHHFNSFSEGGPQTNLGLIYRQMIEMPSAYYFWGEDRWEGLLAESWGFVDGGYEVTLRNDATWDNGTPVSADDLMTTYAIGRILDWQDFNYIGDFEKVDDQTVRFNWIDEPSLVAERLILKSYIRSNEVYGDLAAQAMELYESGAEMESDEWNALQAEILEFRPEEYRVTGPYTYTLDDVGDAFMTLSWQPNSIFSDSVAFGEIRLATGETESTTPLVLEGAIAHSTNVYPPATQQAFEGAGIRLVTIPRGYGPALLFNHDVYPWNVTAVRQAAAMVIEREENAFLTNGFGATGTEFMAGIPDDMVPVWMTEEDIAALDRYEFDTDRAASVLEEAGFSRNEDGIWADADGVTISAEYKFPAEFADFSAAAQNATDQMNDFGFDVTARAVPWQQTAEDIRDGNFDLSVWSWANQSPFPTNSFFNPVQRFNYVGLTSTNQPGMNFQMEFEYDGEMINLDEMINNVNVGVDVEEQRARVGEVALIINDLMPFIPLNYILSTEPWNEELLAGGPEDGDPILANAPSDHFLIWLLLNGQVTPN